MTDVPTAALVGAVVVVLLLAAVLSAGETAMLRGGRGALAELEDSTLPSARRVVRLMDDPAGAAASVALVRVLLEAVGAVGLVLALTATGWPWWQVLVIAWALFGAVAVLVVRWVPRRMGGSHPVGTLVLTSAPLTVARAVARPLRSVTSASATVNDDPLREMVDRASESDNLEDEDREMFRSVLELGDTITRAVMVPRTEMITLPAGTVVRKALALFLRSGFSRLPVVGESVDDVVGVLYLKDVVRRRHSHPDRDDEPVDPLVRAPAFVPESKPVDDLLRTMQQGAFHMAMVVDEFGGIAGLVTIEDALEEIVGELTDEHDRSGPEVEDLGEGTYRVPSRLPVDELGELFDLELEDDDVDTAGGLLAKALGKVPLVGSSARVGELELTADRAEGRRRQLSTLRVRRVPVARDDDGGAGDGSSAGAADGREPAREPSPAPAQASASRRRTEDEPAGGQQR